MKKIKELYIKYKEIINYLIFGVLTTIVSFVVYIIFAKGLKFDEIISNIISWIISVLFAYITNKIFVFESKNTSKKETLKELSKFYMARIVSGILGDIGLFVLMVKVFEINDIFSKLFTQIIVIILNYIFSKWLVFRKKHN